MGQTLSQCSSVSDCMDMNPVMMQKAEDGPQTESPPQPVLASAIGKGMLRASEAERYQDPRMVHNPLRTEDKLFDRTPRSKAATGRAHATARSFGDRSPDYREEPTSGADRVLDDLRERFAMSGMQTPTDPAQIEAMIAREREYLMDAGEQAQVEESGTDTALVRSAMHVVAERYVTEGINALIFSPNAANGANSNTNQKSVPKTQFSRRRKEDGELDRSSGRNLTGRFDQVMTPRSGHSTLRSTDGSAYSDDSGDREHDNEHFDLGDASDFIALNISTKIGENSIGDHKKTPRGDQLLTIAQVLPTCFGITLQDMERLGTPPPPQMLELRMSEEDWERHFAKSGMDHFINRLARELNPSAPSKSTRPAPAAPGPGKRAAGPETEHQSSAPRGWGSGPEASTSKTDAPQDSNRLHSKSGPQIKAQSSTPKSAEAELPAGWKSYTSRSTGRVFYKNKMTGTTQWQRPTEAAQGVSNHEQEQRGSRNGLTTPRERTNTPAATPRSTVHSDSIAKRGDGGRDTLRPAVSGSRGKILAATEQWVQDMQYMSEAGLTPRKSPRSTKDINQQVPERAVKVHADVLIPSV